MKLKLNHAVAVFSILLAIAGTSCKFFGKDKDIADPYANVLPNPAFEKDPPRPSDVKISLLAEKNELGNLLYEATLPKERIKESTLAVMVSDSVKIVLHDDGENGDRKAGDGIFSTVMNVDADSLTSELRSQAAVGEELFKSGKPVSEFTGRLQLPASKFIAASFKETRQISLKEGISIKDIVKIPLLLAVPEVVKHNSLTVTDPGVVNDPTRTFNPCDKNPATAGTAGGAWTFAKLMTDLDNSSPGISPADFVLHWMESWKLSTPVNGDPMPSRNAIDDIINTWHTLSGGPAVPLNINKAPFKLLAIVNRFDLRTGGAYGGGNAGEGRFVFCATDANCNPTRFLVIFEYGVVKRGCPAIHNYAQQWLDLQSLAIGSAAYNNALQAITDQFAAAGTDPSKPNQSSLDQLRTNEVQLDFPWQLREFHIDAASHQLINVTTKREPQIPFNSQGAAPVAANVAAFGEFVNNNVRPIIDDKMEIPDNISISGVNVPFLGGKANTLDPSNFHWDAVTAAGAGHIANDTARFHISLNACSGCHGGETNTGNFTHVGLPSGAGPATLSHFLTGDPAFSNTPFLVSDRAGRPSGAPIQWPFNDLERRGRDLANFLQSRCFLIPDFPRRINQRVPIWMPIELTRRLNFDPVSMKH